MSDAEAARPVPPAGPWWGDDVERRRRAVGTGEPGGRRYGELVEAFRDLQDRFVEAVVPEPAVAGLLDELRALAGRLRQWEVTEVDAAAGRRPDLPGRGHPFLVPLVVTESGDDRVVGRVTFRALHLGGNGAAHGGALPLLFDEVLGNLANAGGRPIARTAYLTVNYRKVTVVGVEHRLEVALDREEGRKRWVRGVLYDPAGDVVSDAEGLFVQLRPGQP